MICKSTPQHGKNLLIRFISTGSKAIDEWAQTTTHLSLRDHISLGHLTSLYATLPTRYRSPTDKTKLVPGNSLGYGHHLVFFYPRNPESQLRQDGTDADFCPPEPFTRRMWAGGRFFWDNTNKLHIGDDAIADISVKSVEFKGQESKSPMVFVNQELRIGPLGFTQPSVIEERIHVYLPQAANFKRGVREVPTPLKYDFKLNYTPTPTTLFRFSALTFNGHLIHLDRDYAQKVEGYAERLIHGPFTALMLLEATVRCCQGLTVRSMEYRAQNPLVVNNELGIYGSWVGDKRLFLWCKEEKTGTVGMTGMLEAE